MSTDAKIISATILVSVIILVGGVFFALRQPSPSLPKENIIAENGLHWHPKLTIVIKGKEQKIPKDIGIGAVHQPVHTHDDTGIIHLEFSGVVTKDDLRLKQFFRNWGKKFNETCIFDKCNGKEGKVTFFVNGKENKEFENYQMKDGDKIEIRYE